MSVWKRIDSGAQAGTPEQGWMLTIGGDVCGVVRPAGLDRRASASWSWQIERQDVVVACGVAPNWALALGGACDYLRHLMEMSVIPILSGHTTNRICYIVDLEASALGPGSYPIEIAIADTAEGKDDDSHRTARSWLIKPTAQWLDSGIWTPESERIHGIGLDELLRNGLAVTEVCQELTSALPGISTLYSDAVGLDSSWLDKLFAAAGMRSPFKVEPLPPLLDDLTVSGGLSGAAEIESARDAAFRRYPQEHRALPDARRNAEIVRELLGATGE
jgi:hypothetical protein